MHDHRHPAPQPRQFSLAQLGVVPRLAIALGLVALIWFAILPLVIR